MLKRLIFALLVCCGMTSRAQDTFSILAFDSITREVGAAGASCLDLFNFPQYSNDFICELFPDSGAVATQAQYIQQNQVNARNRMRQGDSPSAIMAWLQANDAANDPPVRQYGAVNLRTNSTAAFTGSNCTNYKNHITGPNYSIHGNILLGQEILDSMEARFLREPGDLACKLMAAMQGAKVPGADSRCVGNNTSSLFAFLKVSLPSDQFGQPTLLISLKTPKNAGIEPIDSLQKMFDALNTCEIPNPVAIKANSSPSSQLLIKNSGREFMLDVRTDGASFQIHNLQGQLVFSRQINRGHHALEIEQPAGIYLASLKSEKATVTKKVALD